MAKPAGLCKRGSFYKVRKIVPNDLVGYLKKTAIIRSLKTSDYREACKLCAGQMTLINAELEEARRNMLEEGAEPKPAIKLDDMPDSEIMGLAFLWLDDVSRKSYELNLKDTKSYDDFDIKHNLLETRQEEAELRDAVKRNDFTHIRSIASSLLKKKDISFDSQAQSYRLLCKFLNRAMLESLTRDRRKLQGKVVTEAVDSLFKGRGFYPQVTNLNSQQGQDSFLGEMTLGKLINEYDNLSDRDHVKAQTRLGYSVIFRILKEHLGVNTPVKAVTRRDCRDVRDNILRKWPVNAKQNFPDKTVAQILKANEKEKRLTLSKTTVNSYMGNFSALMKYAKRELYITANPAEDLSIRDPIKVRDKQHPFSADDLNKIFTAPIYTGCIDDERSFKERDPNNHPRRARFWVPVIALYTGARANEICQLEVNEICQLEVGDVVSLSEIDCIELVRSNEKSIKSESGVRFIPIHPMLKKIGFMDYVEKMRGAGHKRLFPELEKGSKGYYSEAFLTWFNDRFLTHVNVKRQKISFHSFRHNFADALKAGKVLEQYADALGGWSNSQNKSTGTVRYGHGYRADTLYEELCKIEYNGLDLSHLYKQDGR